MLVLVGDSEHREDVSEVHGVDLVHLGGDDEAGDGDQLESGNGWGFQGDVLVEIGDGMEDCVLVEIEEASGGEDPLYLLASRDEEGVLGAGERVVVSEGHFFGVLEYFGWDIVIRGDLEFLLEQGEGGEGGAGLGAFGEVLDGDDRVVGDILQHHILFHYKFRFLLVFSIPILI